MGLADEDLWKRGARADAIPHLLTKRRIGSDIVFGERGFFPRQQRFGSAAIAAARAGVDLDDSRHVALCLDRKSTRLNSSHLGISYAVFCLKKKRRATT